MDIEDLKIGDIVTLEDGDEYKVEKIEEDDIELRVRFLSIKWTITPGSSSIEELSKILNYSVEDLYIYENVCINKAMETHKSREITRKYEIDGKIITRKEFKEQRYK